MKNLLKKETTSLIVIIILAAIIRLVALFSFGTYTFDDLFSVHFAGMDLKAMFSFLKNEVHPPIFYLLLHFWLKIFGSNEITARLLSLIFSLGIIPLLFYLTKKITNKFTAYLTIIIFALSYFQIFAAIQVRMYSLLTFLGLTSLVLFWLIFVENKKNLGFLYILTNILMMFTHLGGIFGLITQWLWFLILVWKKQIDKVKIKKFILSQIIILVVWFLWLVPFFLPKIKTIINQGWYFNLDHNQNAALGIYDYFFLLLKNYWFRLISASLIFIAPFILLLWPEKKSQKINPNWFLFAWVSPAFLVSLVSGINYTRIFIIPYLGFYIITAYFFYLVWQNHKKLFYCLITVWFLISLLNLGQNLTNAFSRWDLATQWLAAKEKPEDKIILPYFIYELNFKYYYQGKHSFQSFYPINDNKNFDQKIVEKNWQQIINQENINQLSGLTKDTQRVFVIYEVSPPDRYLQSLIQQWFEKNNWQIQEIFDPLTLLGPKVIIYSRSLLP